METRSRRWWCRESQASEEMKVTHRQAKCFGVWTLWPYWVRRWIYKRLQINTLCLPTVTVSSLIAHVTLLQDPNLGWPPFLLLGCHIWSEKPHNFSSGPFSLHTGNKTRDTAVPERDSIRGPGLLASSLGLWQSADISSLLLRLMHMTESGTKNA